MTKCFPLLLLLSLLMAPGCRDEPTAPNATPRALEITADGFTIVSGTTLQLKAVVTLQDGSTQDVTENTIWSTAPGTIGSIDEDARFNAFQRQSGSETITAEYQGETATKQLVVLPRVRKLDILPLQPIVRSGESLQFKALVTFEDGQQQFVTEEASWAVSPAAMGAINEAGMLQAQGMGKAMVQVSHQAEALNAPMFSDTAEVEIVATEEASLIGLFDMVEIPAGTFTMGSNQGHANEQPEHEVFVDRFYISRLEITAGQYLDFLNAALARGAVSIQDDFVVGVDGRFAGRTYLLLTTTQHLSPFITFTQDGFRLAAARENDPMLQLSWYGAMALCDFYGLRLPTEAEWEKASRGGQQRRYGTQDGTIRPELANFGGGGPRVVGSFEPNPFGLHDMAGNAGEFVFDTYDADFYSVSPSDNPFGPGPREPLIDVVGPVVWRGGSFLSDSLSCRSSFRGVVQRVPDIFAGEDTFGFRVVK